MSRFYCGTCALDVTEISETDLVTGFYPPESYMTDSMTTTARPRGPVRGSALAAAVSANANAARCGDKEARRVARGNLATERLIQMIGKTLAEAPRLSPEQRARIVDAVYAAQPIE